MRDVKLRFLGGTLVPRLVTVHKTYFLVLQKFQKEQWTLLGRDGLVDTVKTDW